VTDAGGPRQGGSAGDSWEQRAAGLASEIQRWLIRTSARSMRDELGGQVKKALRGAEPDPRDIWATATTEPPQLASEPPECAWCPVCRAARRISQSRSGADARGGPRLADAADVMAAAVRDALAGLDTILSYRPPPDAGAPGEPGPPHTGQGQRPAGQPQPAGEELRKEAQESGPPPAPPAAPAGRASADQTEEPEDEPPPAPPAAPAGRASADQTEEPEDEPGDRG
jgi:hypothetical protein